eukprot:Phypoly_transcript_02344.p1 GENE.Phypoly_transcript_02344~~Phypoly_transcript_02344.p1  ORF type:complete len:892 (+),score=111.01 Phypoly_transcript_02344:67-2742(+)
MLRAITQDPYVIHQKKLETSVRALFPSCEVISNARKVSQVFNPQSGNYLEIDVWLPELGLCLEFQDTYHYVATWYSQKSLSLVHDSDNTKTEQLRMKGETLLVVPCWWDGTTESLSAIINFYRPDLLTTELPHLVPPLNPSIGFFDAHAIPDVGELMLASFPNDVSHITPENPWWLGEKYDGIRFCWNSYRKLPFSRNGMLLELPKSFTRLFGKTFLDSEAWFGRGNFLSCQKLVSADLETIEWSLLRIVTFDIPEVSMRKVPFEGRYKALLSSIDSMHPFLIIVSRMRCTSKLQLKTLAESVLNEGGEGLILRKAKSLYIPGRSDLLLKFKASRGDIESLVVQMSPNTIQLQLPNGIVFNLENVPEKQSLKDGDIVTITYDNLSPNSVPVNPKISRVRNDVSWNEVERNHATQLNEPSRSAIGPPKHPGNYAEEKKSAIRVFLETLARKRGIDPRSAENWYSLASSPDLRQEIGRKLALYNNSLISALQDLFPDIGIDESKFSFLQKNFWKNMQNRRKFFETIAHDKGFDSSSPSNWYALSYAQVLSYKGGETILKYYEKSLSKALMHIFPEIGLKDQQFPFMSKNFWNDVKNRRKFFENVAKEEGLDPLAPTSWYKIPYSKIILKKGGASVLWRYNGNLPEALMHVFPDIGLVKSNFRSITPAQWQDVSSRRKFFEIVAKKLGFDPLIPAKWYSTSYPSVRKFKGASSVMKYYGGNLRKALRHLFPEIGLDYSKFRSKEKKWLRVSARRKLLEKVAHHLKFDPLHASNWYDAPPGTSLLKTFRGQGLDYVLKLYKGSLISCLEHLFPEIGLQRSKFRLFPRNHWADKGNRCAFFEDFARAKGFSPREHDKWATVSNSDLLHFRGGNSVLALYGRDKNKALADLFPDFES